MEFILSQAKHWHTDEEKKLYKGLGFTFELEKDEEWAKEHGRWYSGNSKTTIEISTLEELMALISKCGSGVVASESRITIYNDYLE